LTDVAAQRPMDVKTIALLVDQHRNTIAPDSEIQRAMHWISSALGRALQDVASQVRAMCHGGYRVGADYADLDEFLGEVPTCRGAAETLSSHYR
jgi:ribulose bisphosphate carboxylase small subunit